jgi:hypothetical protein
MAISHSGQPLSLSLDNLGCHLDIDTMNFDVASVWEAKYQLSLEFYSINIRIVALELRLERLETIHNDQTCKITWKHDIFEVVHRASDWGG